MTGEPIETATRSKTRRLYVLLLLLLPLAVQAIVVGAFAENALVWDEFVYVKPFRNIGEGKPWLHWIWHQHNEHRIVLTKLLLFAHAGFSGWNPMVDMYVSALMVGVIAWGIWKLYRAAGNGHPAYFIPVALLLCSLAQYMNMLYGLMTCHYFTIAGMVWAIVFLMRRKWSGLIAGVLAAFAAMVSTLNAIIIWPIGFVVLFMTRQTWPRWILWTAGMAGCLVAYFRRYNRPGQIPIPDWSSSATILHAADGFLLNLGLALSAATITWSRALGLMTLMTIGFLWAGVWISRTRESHAGLVALSLIALGTAAAVGAVRSQSGPAPALESKYVTYSTLGLIAPYLGIACLPDFRSRKEILAGFTGVLCVGLVAANLYGFHAAKEWQKNRRYAKYLLHTIEIQPDESLGSVYFPSRIREAAAYLRAARLGPFRDTVDVLAGPRWREAAATDPITVSAPIHARVLCPVDTLQDVGIVMTRPPGDPAAGIVRVTVNADGAVVARGQIDAKTVSGVQFVRAQLGEPLRACRGRELAIDVSSDAADPRLALRSWSYPVYYAGVARQGNEKFERRSLGIAFNAFSYGLVE